MLPLRLMQRAYLQQRVGSAHDVLRALMCRVFEPKQKTQKINKGSLMQAVSRVSRDVRYVLYCLWHFLEAEVVPQNLVAHLRVE